MIEFNRTGNIAWLTHDLVAGSLAGAVVGFVLTWFRYAVGVHVEHWSIEPVALLVGAAAGVAALRWERCRQRERPHPGPVTLAVWGLGIAAAAYMALLIYALSNFE